jgi:hypothetical protein
MTNDDYILLSSGMYHKAHVKETMAWGGKRNKIIKTGKR